MHAPDGAPPVFRADCGPTIPLLTGVASHGQRGIIALRPEAIALLGPGEAAAAGATVADVVVRRVTYLGALRKYRVVTETGGELRVDCQVGPLDAHERPMAEGTAARVAWLPTSCTFQPAAPGRAAVKRPAWMPLLLSPRASRS